MSLRAGLRQLASKRESLPLDDPRARDGGAGELLGHLSRAAGACAHVARRLRPQPRRDRVDPRDGEHRLDADPLSLGSPRRPDRRADRPRRGSRCCRGCPRCGSVRSLVRVPLRCTHGLRRCGSERERRQRAGGHELVRSRTARLRARDQADGHPHRRGRGCARAAAGRRRQGASAPGCSCWRAAASEPRWPARSACGRLRRAPKTPKLARSTRYATGGSGVSRSPARFWSVRRLSILAFTVLFLHGERGLTTAVAAAVLALMQVLGAGLRIGMGRWSDKVGARVAPLLRLSFALSRRSGRQRRPHRGAARPAPPGARRSGRARALLERALVHSHRRAGRTGAKRRRTRVPADGALGGIGGDAPLFAVLVDASSWGIAFGCAALLPLAGAGVVRRVSI